MEYIQTEKLGLYVGLMVKLGENGNDDNDDDDDDDGDDNDDDDDAAALELRCGASWLTDEPLPSPQHSHMPDL